jgi:septal ring factor EnvC (AmiA/AmiB activator)
MCREDIGLVFNADFLGLRFIRETLMSILLQLSRIERAMSELDSQVNARLDEVESAIAEEKVQFFAIAEQVKALRDEIVNLKSQLGEAPVLTTETIARIESLVGKIGDIVVAEETSTV